MFSIFINNNCCWQWSLLHSLSLTACACAHIFVRKKFQWSFVRMKLGDRSCIVSCTKHPAERSEHMHKIISDVDGQPRKYAHIRYIVQTILEREKKSLSTTVSRRAHLKIFMLKLKQFSAHFYICFFGRLDALFSTCAQQ